LAITSPANLSFPDHRIVQDLQVVLPISTIILLLPPLWIYCRFLIKTFHILNAPEYEIKVINPITKIVIGTSLLITVLIWAFGPVINSALLNSGLERYEPVIQAIENYKADSGSYPEDLNKLVPIYLPSAPGLYFKFAQNLVYTPAPKLFAGLPYYFGLQSGLGLRMNEIMYCPKDESVCNKKIIDAPKYFRRINTNWILIIHPWF
jgi:hypothetical protein